MKEEKIITKKNGMSMLLTTLILLIIFIAAIPLSIYLFNERKAAMVSNLLVVLCGNKDAQPIVNSGSIY